MCDELDILDITAHYRLTRVWRTYNIATDDIRLLVSSCNVCNNFYAECDVDDDNLLPFYVRCALS